ncbi:class I glutamine amidotransferase-like protein [Macrolepiota fuliginosa MF-IS2]|uniref:Class I glutamine amidotransferase-like protein n=1 Tax=Macrolepiota fuliginosa MF-IS2 TaxID=1400762 RepID=A0A9P6C9S5_9AGAR|nr:class I glutamine amidotransferase-like protein [Macrolepiota fuliginosa MF-IS2]
MSPLGKAAPGRILIYSRTVGFRHDSIPTAIQSLRNHSTTINVVFDQTEDPAEFTDENLQKYDALLFLSTTGESDGKTALQSYLNKGGNFVAVHSASDSLRNTTFYGKELAGSYFDYHPALQNATVDVIGPNHPSTSGLPSAWKVVDEMYNFVSDPRSLGAVVVLAANESSYVDDGTRKFDQGTPHPIAWFQEHGAGVDIGDVSGRSFYTGLGHLNETWQDELFLSHVLGGIQWTLLSNTTLAFNATALVGNMDNESRTTPTGAATSQSSPSPSTPQ